MFVCSMYLFSGQVLAVLSAVRVGHGPQDGLQMGEVPLGKGEDKDMGAVCEGAGKRTRARARAWTRTRARARARTRAKALTRADSDAIGQ